MKRKADHQTRTHRHNLSPVLLRLHTKIKEQKGPFQETLMAAPYLLVPAPKYFRQRHHIPIPQTAMCAHTRVWFLLCECRYDLPEPFRPCETGRILLGACQYRTIKVVPKDRKCDACRQKLIEEHEAELRRRMQNGNSSSTSRISRGIRKRP
jgi:hypothetical protein